jgi:hypothetical protein
MSVRAALTMITLAACASRAEPAATPAASMTPAAVAPATPATTPISATATAPISATAPPTAAAPTAPATPSAPAPGDPLHVFVQQWPRVGTELVTRQAARLLWEGKPCAGFDSSPPTDERNAEPALGAAAPASVSPDGRTLVVVTTMELDHAGAVALGLARGSSQDEGTGTLAVVFDGPSGAFWAHSLSSFMSCNFNFHGFTWSADSHRVYVATDTGHGERVALLDVAARQVRFQGFVGLQLASPGIEHVAWMPWFSGYPFANNPPGQVNGDVLSIDDHQVWGSSDMNAAQVWDVAWQSDTTLTFCGRTPNQRGPIRFRVVLASQAGTSAQTVKVTRLGADCPPDGPRWID